MNRRYELWSLDELTPRPSFKWGLYSDSAYIWIAIGLIFKLIFQHSMELFGCFPPFLGNDEIPICKNSSFYSWDEVEKLIDCPKPCTIYKMQPRTTLYLTESDGTYSAWLDIRFQETTTISTDQYSYTWLTLVAEVGGYVGLFLGYSVYQMTDLLDIFLKWSKTENAFQKICKRHFWASKMLKFPFFCTNMDINVF